jgi:hypothetical protein
MGKGRGYLCEIDLLGGASKGNIGETGIDRSDLLMNFLENSAIHARSGKKTNDLVIYVILFYTSVQYMSICR